jgi:polyisoprenoid-binding protein YceI
MKKILVAALCCVFALALSFAVFSSTASAGKQSFADKFAAGDTTNQTEDMSGTYSFDKAHSFIGFRIKHYGLIEVPGYFRDFTGTVNYDAKDASKSTVEFTAKMTSVDTGVAPRDEHLRRADFFEVEKYPDMTFKSTKVVKNGNQWTVTGDFTMKGVTKSITFPFTIAGIIPQRGMKMGLTAETTINRRDYGINYGEVKPGTTPTLADDVKVVLQIEANKPQPKPAAAPAE